MENPAHLPKYLFDKAVEMGIHTITLNFSGGSDEGYLQVHFSGDFDSDKGDPYNNGFTTLIEDWAWDAYSYSGAGCGEDYGDDIEYNLITKKVYVSDWHMVRKDSETEEDDMTVDDSVSEEEESVNIDINTVLAAGIGALFALSIIGLSRLLIGWWISKIDKH